MTHWRAEFARWGHPTRHAGALDPTAREHFIYWIYNDVGRCIYVGRTCRPEQRRYEHKRNSPHMYAQAARLRMAGPYRLPQAVRIEREQLELLRPAYGGGHMRFNENDINAFKAAS